ncbi:MAG TPA: response regulator [Casimicrobiaceae bacterium]|nr:response regulator [Myxococcota bacterium]HTS23029.1 response regulator [Casimicrobiaceae bacterium]
MARIPLISVVDDDDSFRESLLGYFRSVGFAARGFASAAAFLDSGELELADCVTLDVRMPGMSGPALQSQLRRLRPDLPIVFITAHGDETTRARVLQEGAIACLPKPFDGRELLTAIHTAVGERDD